MRKQLLGLTIYYRKASHPMSETKIIPTTGRNNCGGRCIIYAHVRDGIIEKLSTETTGTPEHPVPLCACARGLNYHKTFLSEDRLHWPMKRTGERGEGKFSRISWKKPGYPYF